MLACLCVASVHACFLTACAHPPTHPPTYPPVCRRCDAKDQMIHLFAMPPTWDPYTPAAQSEEWRGAEDSSAEL